MAAAMTAPLEYDLTLFPDPVLRKRAEPVPVDDEARDLVRAMFATMYASKGVGLAAPQVGLKKRVLVLNEHGDAEHPEGELALLNPTIVERSGAPEVAEEGCLSFPGIYAEVERPSRCRVEYDDLEGRRHVRDFDGFVARIVQHEYDHLEGVLLVDRMSAADKHRHRVALEELKDRYRRALAKSASAR
jgi:peptide deformylase